MKKRCAACDRSAWSLVLFTAIVVSTILHLAMPGVVFAEDYEGSLLGEYRGLVMEEWLNDPQLRNKLDQLRTKDHGALRLEIAKGGSVSGTVDFPLLGTPTPIPATGRVTSSGDLQVTCRLKENNPDDPFPEQPWIKVSGRVWREAGELRGEGKVQIRTGTPVDPETGKPIRPKPSWGIGDWKGSSLGTTGGPSSSSGEESGEGSSGPSAGLIAAILGALLVAILVARSRSRGKTRSAQGSATTAQDPPTEVITGREARNRLLQTYQGQLIKTKSGKTYVPVPRNWGGGILGGGYHRTTVVDPKTGKRVEVIDPRKPVSLVVPSTAPTGPQRQSWIPKGQGTSGISSQMKKHGFQPRVVQAVDPKTGAPINSPTTNQPQKYVVVPSKLPGGVSGSAWQTKTITVKHPRDPNKLVQVRVIDPNEPVMVQHEPKRVDPPQPKPEPKPKPPPPKPKPKPPPPKPKPKPKPPPPKPKPKPPPPKPKPKPPPPKPKPKPKPVDRQKLKKKLEKLQKLRQQAAKTANRWAWATWGAELFQTAIDTSIDVLSNLTGAAGKTLKRVYKVAKGVGTGLGKGIAEGNMAENLAKGTVAGVVDLGVGEVFDKTGAKVLEKVPGVGKLLKKPGDPLFKGSVPEKFKREGMGMLTGKQVREALKSGSPEAIEILTQRAANAGLGAAQIAAKNKLVRDPYIRDPLKKRLGVD